MGIYEEIDGIKIYMGRGLSEWIIKAINFVEEHFDLFGTTIYESDPQLLYDWYDVRKSFEKFYSRVSDSKLIKEKIEYDYSNFDAYEDAINRIDGILSQVKYPFIVYDGNILSKWQHVMNYLVNYAETKWHREIEN